MMTLEPLRYYFLYWVSKTDPHDGGSQVFKMHGEFDLFWSHLELQRMHKTICVITNWTEITEAQYRQYYRYLVSVSNGSKPSPILRLVSRRADIPADGDPS